MIIEILIVILLFLQFSKRLSEFIDSQKITDLKVWTSELKRTAQTAAHIKAPKEKWMALNEISAVSSFDQIIITIHEHTHPINARARARTHTHTRSEK